MRIVGRGQREGVERVRGQMAPPRVGVLAVAGTGQGGRPGVCLLGEQGAVVVEVADEDVEAPVAAASGQGPAEGEFERGPAWQVSRKRNILCPMSNSRPQGGGRASAVVGATAREPFIDRLTGRSRPAHGNVGGDRARSPWRPLWQRFQSGNVATGPEPGQDT